MSSDASEDFWADILAAVNVTHWEGTDATAQKCHVSQVILQEMYRNTYFIMFSDVPVHDWTYKDDFSRQCYAIQKPEHSYVFFVIAVRFSGGSATKPLRFRRTLAGGDGSGRFIYPELSVGYTYQQADDWIKHAVSELGAVVSPRIFVAPLVKLSQN